MSGDLDRKGNASDEQDLLEGDEELDAPADQLNKLLLNRSDVLAALQAPNLAVSFTSN